MTPHGLCSLASCPLELHLVVASGSQGWRSPAQALTRRPCPSTRLQSAQGAGSAEEGETEAVAGFSPGLLCDLVAMGQIGRLRELLQHTAPRLSSVPAGGPSMPGGLCEGPGQDLSTETPLPALVLEGEGSLSHGLTAGGVCGTRSFRRMD